MPRRKRNICQSCERLFIGRSDAKTCSVKCRKRLQRTKLFLAKETELAKTKLETLAVEAEHILEPAYATQDGFIGEAVPVKVIRPTPPQAQSTSVQSGVTITPPATTSTAVTSLNQSAPITPNTPVKSAISNQFIPDSDKEEIEEAIKFGQSARSSRNLLRFMTSALGLIALMAGLLAILSLTGLLPTNYAQKITVTKLGDNINNVNNQITALSYQIKTLKGESGAVGQVGQGGAQGAGGAAGQTGASGVAGSTGEKGETGDTGATGAQGPAGANGATGSTGPQGPQGPSGTATCPNGLCVSLQSSSPGTQESGNINISGNMNVGGVYEVAGVQIASINLSDGGNLAKLNGTGPQVFTGNNRFTALLTVANVFNTTNAFQVQNANSTAVFTTDTVNNRVAILKPTASFTLDVGGDINTSGLYRINGVQISTANLSNSSNIALLSANQTFSGVNSFTNGSNSFSGSGAGLSNLNASNITTGTINEARLPTTFVKLDSDNTFTGTNTFRRFQSSTTAFQVQNSGGSNILNVDTLNGRVAINKSSPSFTLDVGGSINGTSITGTSVSATTLLQNNNEVCDVTGNCAGIGGTVGGSGTIGYIPYWSGSGTLSDSNISLSGSTVGVLGNLNVNDINFFTPSHYYLNGHVLNSGDLGDSNNIAHLSNSQTFTGGNTFWGDATFRKITNSATAFQIQNAAGSNMMTSNNITGVISINQTNSDTPLSVSGYINAGTAYKVNGTAGTGITCTDGSIIQNAVVVGGIITDGDCVVNGGELSGTLTIQNVYDNSSTGRITTSSPSKGFSVRAGSGNDSTSVFQVQNSNSGNVLSVDTTTNSVSVDEGNLTVRGLSAPSGPSLSSSASGGTLGAASYYYKMAAINVNGTTEAVASIPLSVTTSGSASQNTLSWSTIPNAVSYNLYRSTNGTSWAINNVAATSMVDNGSNFSWGTGATPPAANTSGGNLTVNGNAVLQNATNSSSAVVVLDAIGTSVLDINTTSRYVGINNSTPQATLDVQASSQDFSDGFETAALIPFAASATGNASIWSVSSGSARAGTYKVRGIATTTFPAVGGTTSLTLSKTLNTNGYISFYFVRNNGGNTASTNFSFYIDGVQQYICNNDLFTSIACPGSYTFKSFNLTPGTHNFLWYLSSGGGTGTEDISVDDVLITNTSTGSAAIFNGGNVGIGTTSPNASLETVGTALFRPSTGDTATQFQIQNAAGGAIFNVDTLGSNITVSQGNLLVTGLGIPPAPTFSVGNNQGGQLSGGSTYYYKITAVNSSGGETLASPEAPFNGANFTTLNPPGAPSLALTAGTDLNIGLYRYKVTFVTPNGETTGGTTASITTTSGNQDINLTNIPLGPAGTTARKIYRTSVGGADGTQKLVATVNDNSTTVYSDTSPDGSLGASLPGSNTATTDSNNLVLSFSTIQGATSYRIYRGTSSGNESAYQVATTSPFTDTGAGGTGSSTPTSSGVEKVGIGTSTPTANLDVAGNVLFQNAINTTTAFQVQNAAGSSNLLIADTVNNRIGIGKAPTQGVLDVNGQIYQNGSPVCDTSNNCVGIGGGGAIGGGGTTGTIPIFTGTGFTIGDSILTQSGSTVSAAGNLNVTGMYQVNGVQVTSAILSNDANLAKLNANQTFTGINTFSNSSNSFTGSGAGLSSLNASNISSGTLTDGRLSANVALLNATQTFSGNSNTFQNTSNSTSAFKIQNSAGTSNLFIADTSNTRIGIGKAPTLGTLDVNGAIYQSGNQVCDTSGNCTGGGGTAIGGSGTAGTIALFTGSGVTIGNSILTQSGSTVSAAGDLTINGSVLAKNTSNSTSAFRIQDASSSNIFAVDTSNKYIGINQALPNAALDVSATSGSFFDGFESGTLTPFTNSGNANWVISSSSPHTGSFYANSGTLTSNGQSSVLTLTKTLNSPGTISFWYKTDAQGSSFGRFAIDGGTQINCTSSVGCASGSWTQFTSSSLTAGSHTFTWTAQCNFNTLFAYFLLDDVTVTNAGAGSAATFNGGSVGVGTYFPVASLDVAAMSSTVDAINVTNGTSTGAIAKFLDGGSANPVFSLADGGAATYRNQTDSTAAFSIQNAAGTSTLNADTTNRYIGINTSAPNAALDVAASSASFFDGFETGSLSPFTNVGSVNWATQASSARTGTWSATGNLPAFNAGPARMQLARTVNSPGTVSFYFFNTSGGLTNGFLNFQFLIDGAQQYQCWKGAGGSPSCATSYSQLSFAVASGAHTFEWRVNGSSSSGAMIITVDDINITNAGTANAALINGGLVGIGTPFPNATLDLAAVGSTTDALNVSNSSSTGAIAKFFDGGSTNAVFSLADGGAATFRNQTNSTTALSIQNASGTSVLNADTTNRYVGINNSAPNAVLDVVGISGSFFDGFESSLLPPFTTSASGGGNLWTVSSTDPRTGTFHARVTDDQTNGRRSNLTLVRTLSSPGTISFYWKNTLVNDGSMGAIFQIDGVTQTGCGLGFGACASYALNSFAVTSGTHTFLWQGQVNSAAPQGIDFRLDDVTVTNAGTATSALFNGGNVGIGTAFPTQTLEVSGTALFGNTSNSTTAFQVQNSAGNNYIAVDTSGALVSVGNTSIASSIQIGNTTGAVAQTIGVGNNATASSTTALTMGNLLGTSSTVIQGGTGASAISIQSGSGGTIAIGASGVASTVQIGNTTGAVAQTINIGNNPTASSSTTIVIGSTIGLSPVTIQAGSSGILISSATLVKPTNSATAFQVQDSAGTSNLLIADTTSSKVGVGKAPTFGKLDVNGAIYQSGNQVCDTSGNCVGTGGGGSIGGSGTAGTIALFTGSGFTIGDSQLVQSAGTITNTGSLTTTGLDKITGSFLLQNTTNSTTALQVQNSIGSNALSVDTTSLNSFLTNSSFENSSVSSWVYLGTPGSVARDTTQAYLGLASLKVITSANTSNGVKYVTGNGAGALAISTTYTISWYDKLDGGSAALSDITAVYARDGSSETACTGINTQSVVTSGWTRHTCQIVTDGTSPASTAYVGIEQTAGAVHTFYIDSVQIEASTSATAYKETGISLNGVVSSAVAFSNQTNSTTAFQIQNAAGTSLFSIDSINSVISLGSPSSTPVLLVLGTKNTSGDPTCRDGAVYYNSNISQFRACANGTWITIGSTDSWNALDGSFTYSSADSPSFVMTTPTDLTGSISLGARIKLTQTSAKYFIVTAIDSTTMTLFGGTDYALANASISNVYYSTARGPAGFPLNPSKWTVETRDTINRSQSNPSASTWYNPGSISVSLPIGSWVTSYQAIAYRGMNSSGDNTYKITLSTANNSESDTDFSAYSDQNSEQDNLGNEARLKTITVSSKTSYFLNIQTITAGGTGSLQIRGGDAPTIIRAVCAYL